MKATRTPRLSRRGPGLRDWARPGSWGIAARSAIVSATVVVVALTLAGAALAGVLYHSLIAGVDSAASTRVRDIVANLQSDPAPDLDTALISTDQRVVAVQILDASGRMVQRSPDAPVDPLVTAGTVGPTLRAGMSPAIGDADMRVSGQITETPTGRYTVLVAAGSQAVESTMTTVAVGLATAAPIVAAVSAVATNRLVGRSLRSVEAIRARVAEISSSDLTERVPVPRHRDEISALATTMNEMLARIESGQQAQRRFVGDASHELRNPLATIISALEVGAAHPTLFDEALATRTLLPEAQRMQLLIDDLLLLARADERGLPLRHMDVDLDDLVSAEITRLRRDTTLNVLADLAPTRLAGDPGALTRVVRNLLDNAARHAASSVEVTLVRGDGHAQLTIADDGPGIPAADRGRVFDRFVRLDTDRARSGGGTGLGLAIVDEIIAAHHGSIGINDGAGGGTVMVVQLPLTNSPESSR